MHPHKKVLLVATDPDTAAHFAFALRTHGCDVLKCLKPWKLPKVLKFNKFDCALLLSGESECETMLWSEWLEQELPDRVLTILAPGTYAVTWAKRSLPGIVSMEVILKHMKSFQRKHGPKPGWKKLLHEAGHGVKM